MNRIHIALAALLVLPACDQGDNGDSSDWTPAPAAGGPKAPEEEEPEGPTMADEYEGTASGGTVTITRASRNAIDIVLRIETADCVLFGAKDDVPVDEDGVFGPVSLTASDGACDFTVRIDGQVSADAADGSWWTVGPDLGGEWEADAT